MRTKTTRHRVKSNKNVEQYISMEIIFCDVIKRYTLQNRLVRQGRRVIIDRYFPSDKSCANQFTIDRNTVTPNKYIYMDRSPEVCGHCCSSCFYRFSCGPVKIKVFWLSLLLRPTGGSSLSPLIAERFTRGQAPVV